MVFNAEPRGFAANNNEGARIARAPLLCLLNNDTALLPGWLEPMARLARRRSDVACVGNVQREPVTGLVDHAGIFFDRNGEVRHAAKDEPAPPREDYLEWPAVTAACCVIRRALFLELGGFDEAFRNGGEDVDFCLRAGTRGYRHFVANRSVIYHHISASPGRKQSEEANGRRFRERWLAFLQTEGNRRRWLGDERQAGWREVRRHLWQPWNWGRFVRQIVAPSLPARVLEITSRAPRRARPGTRRGTGAPVFVVAGDTARTSRRAGVPTAVRRLAGACGRLGAPVQPVGWRTGTRSLCLLPPELSLGLDAERLREGFDPAWREPSVASMLSPSVADWREPSADTPSLHELPDPASVPRGAWILLPEVPDRARTEQLVEYVHRHGWRLAVVFYGALATDEPRFFPFGAPHEGDGYLRAVSGADLVLPVSGTAAALWRRFVEAKGLPQPPVRVCGPGADTCTPTRGTAPPPRAPDAPVRMLCVSEVTPHKNHRALLAAFDLAVAARPDLQLELTLVGVPRLFDEDNVPEALWAFKERHPGRVTWIEWVEYSALRQLYEAADFTVFPSVLEGWGLPIVESLWFGRPCICANFGAMAETAAGGGCVTADVRNPAVLAEAILTLAASPKRRAALAAQIAARPLKTWEDYARELLAVLAAA